MGLSQCHAVNTVCYIFLILYAFLFWIMMFWTGCQSQSQPSKYTLGQLTWQPYYCVPTGGQRQDCPVDGTSSAEKKSTQNTILRLRLSTSSVTLFYATFIWTDWLHINNMNSINTCIQTMTSVWKELSKCLQRENIASDIKSVKNWLISLLDSF